MSRPLLLWLIPISLFALASSLYTLASLPLALLALSTLPLAIRPRSRASTRRIVSSVAFLGATVLLLGLLAVFTMPSIAAYLSRVFPISLSLPLATTPFLGILSWLVSYFSARAYDAPLNLTLTGLLMASLIAISLVAIFCANNLPPVASLPISLLLGLPSSWLIDQYAQRLELAATRRL